MTLTHPWYTYPRIDQFGTIDPQGPYWKPDSNIQVPQGTDITSLGSGVVTSVQRTSWGQNVVTVRLDHAINSLATHMFYEHLSGANVQVGQRVNFGTKIGSWAGGTSPGFGFYGGDVYGSGPAWQQLQNDLCPGCANQLNPVSFLNNLQGGQGMPTGANGGQGQAPAGGGGGGGGGTTTSTLAPQAVPCAPFDIGCGLSNFWNVNVLPFLEHVTLVIFAIVLIIVGFILMGSNPNLNPANFLKKIGTKAAMAA